MIEMTGSENDEDRYGPVERGQSELLGLVMLIGFVIVVGVGVFLVAGSAVSSFEHQSESERVEQSFLELNSQLTTAATSQDASRSMDFSFDEDSARVDPDAGSITVEISGSPSYTIVDEQPLGAVEYERDGERIASQGGGVWKHDGTTSRMLSAPNIQYDESDGESSLTLPVTTIVGDDRIANRATIERIGTEEKYPGNVGAEENLLVNNEVVITIQSEYYEAWGQYFEDRVTDGEVRYLSDETVEITLMGPIEPELAEGPIVSDAPGLALSNSGEIDSYDSSEGPYTAPGGENAPVIVDGDFNPSNSVSIGGAVRANGDAHISNSITVAGTTIIDGDSDISNNPVFDDVYSTGGDVRAWGGTFEDDVIVGEDAVQLQKAEIKGDLHVGGDALDLHNTEVYGDIVAGGDVDDSKVTVHGEIYENGERTPAAPLEPNVELPEPVDGDISNAQSELSASNDNGETETIDANELVGCESSCTLESGSYYLEQISFDGDDALELDTSDGPIALYVEGDMTFAQRSRIEVVGDEGAEVFLNGDLAMSNGAAITVPGDRSPLFWLNMNPDSAASFSNQASFVGMLNGPGSTTEDGVDVHISNKVEIFGAIAGNVDGTSNNNEIHFDEALNDPDRLTDDEEIERLFYLNVVHNEIAVNSD